MPTVLDSFVLEIGLDPTKLDRGQRDAMDKLRRFEQEATKSGKSIEAQSKKTSDMFAQVKKEVLGGIGLFLGFTAAKKFLTDVTNLDAMTGRFSKTIGMNVGDLATWEGAIKQVGGSAQSAVSGLGGLSGELNRFLLTGQGGGLSVFKSLNINLLDQNHHLKTAGQLWLELADAVQGMDPAKAAAFLSMIPGANQYLVNFALLGSKAMKKYLEDSKRSDDSMKDATKSAQDYQKSLTLLDQAVTNLGRHLVDWLMPAIRGTLDLTTAAVKGLDESFQTKPGTPARDAIDRKNQSESEAQMKRLGLGPPGDIFGKWPDEKGGSDSSTGGESGGPTGNWGNFLSGLSYLETSKRNVSNAGSSAKGYFQFLDGTASKAQRSGLPDPQHGNYAQQAAAAMAYIKKFYPQAAAAIDRGDYGKAEIMLRGEWPSLPGGSQPQSAARYRNFFGLLSGGAPAVAPGVASNGRSPGGSSTTKTTNVTVENVHIVAPAANDASSVAKEIGPALHRSVTAAAANSGAQ